MFEERSAYPELVTRIEISYPLKTTSLKPQIAVLLITSRSHAVVQPWKREDDGWHVLKFVVT